jgi:hypothetical protein
MSDKTIPTRRFADHRPVRSYRTAFFAALTSALLIGTLTGCTDTEGDIPKPQVKTVTAYGQTLDQDATVQQVAYVLLRAIADDITAAQNQERDKQKQALNLTFSLAAYSEIEKQILQSEGRKDLGKQPEKKLFKFVKFWAPIAGHYINSFDTDLPAAVKKMKVKPTKDEKSANVYYPVCHDPSETDPAKQQTATLNITLVKEKSGVRSYWRVARIGYRPKTRTQPSPINRT